MYEMIGSIDVTEDNINMVTAYSNQNNPGFVASIQVVETAI